MGIRYASSLLDLISEHRARRSYQQAQAYARKLLTFDPWREDAVRALLVLLYEAGDGAGAISEFNRFALMLEKEMATEPMPETIAVFRAIQSGIPPPGASPPIQLPSEKAIIEPALVARERELERLSNAWHAAAAGNSNSVVISGEAGIGKTRLAREAAVSIESQGGLTVFGSTSHPESMPYQPLAATVRSLCSLAPKLRIEQLWLSALHPLAPEMRAHAPDFAELPPMDATRERTRLFEAMAVFLEAAAKHRPLCIILEDLHWAGAATLEFCGYLVHRLHRSRILWIFTWREEGILVPAPLRDLRAKLNEMPSTHLSLRSLKFQECAQLLSENGSNCGRLYTYSGGNPFYFLELARNPPAFSSDPVALPAALRELVLARSAGLSERAQTLLQVAAVAGTTFDLDLLSGVTGWSEVQCLDALEELMDNRLVRERTQSSSFSFSHHLLAAAAYASIDEAQRIRRHRRIAHVLETLRNHLPEFHADIARHFDKAGDAIRASQAYVRAASYALSLYANGEAYGYATRALELTQANTTRFLALNLLVRVVALQGRRDEQGRLTDELLGIASRLERADRCHALRQRIDFANLVSDHATQRLLIGRLEKEAKRCSDVRWKGSAIEARAKLLRSRGEFAAESECFAQLESLIDQGGDRALYAEAYLSHADALVYQGRLSEARPILERVRKFA